MDQEQGPSLRGTIPRLSRLPMPRASQDSLKLSKTAASAAIHQEDSPAGSQLPRPQRPQQSSKITPPIPLGENLNSSIKSRYGWTDQSVRSRNRSPIRDALKAAQSATLDTTPPSSNDAIPVFEEGNENGSEEAAIAINDPSPGRDTKQKRRPRPSLSERTVETLSQVSPSPSPTRRRASIMSNDVSMGPPLRPASSMRNSRPNTPSFVRPESPNKRPFKPPGRASPTKDVPSLPPIQSPGYIYTPPKAFVRDKGSRIAKPMRETRRSMSSSGHSNLEENPPPMPGKPKSQTTRVKSPPLSSNASKPSLANIFKDPPKPSQNKQKLAVSYLDQNPTLLRPRSRGENPLARSPPLKTGEQATKHHVSHQKHRAVPEPESIPSAKSSAMLRETIAKAKAAHKAIESSTQAPASQVAATTSTEDSIILDDLPTGSNKGLLRKRLDSAVSSGQLNIAALKLERMPDEVMKMYAPGISSVDWSEMVDLTKLNAADNQLELLNDEIFPDWSITEMEEDDDKTNQFAGLEALDLHNNILSSLPLGLRRLERLSTLNLNGNKLTNHSLDIIWQMPGLADLSIANNSLTGTLSFENAQSNKLRVLNLQGNKIESLVCNHSTLASLQKLNVSNNSLQQLPWELLATLPLIELTAAKNRLSGVVLQGPTVGFSSLRTLDLSHNAIEQIADGQFELPALQTLAVNANRLAELPDLGALQSLVTILVAENQLKEMPTSLDKLASLRNADFSQNNIKLIEAGISSMESLSILNLAGNPLRDKKYLTMDIADLKLDLEKRFASTHEQPNQGHVPNESCGSGQLTSAGSIGYTYSPLNGVLDLASQNLATIDISTIDLTSSTPIHTLRLSNNDLTTFPFDLLAHPSIKYTLRSLNLSHNLLLHPTAYLTSNIFLPTLQSLYIVSTGLTSLDALITHLQAPELRELNISCHRLAGHVPWIRGWFPTLTTLLATDNWFSSVDVEAVRGLEVLDVKNNEIETLPAKIGLLGNFPSRVSKNGVEHGKLRVFECGGNRFRVPRMVVLEKGTEAVLRDLRRMVPEGDIPEEWREEI